MKKFYFLLLLVFLASQSAFAQIVENPKENSQIKSDKKKRDFFEAKFNLGIDNNQNIMLGVGLAYKHKFSFWGLGGNADLYGLKDSFKPLADESVENPNEPHHFLDYRNSMGYNFDAIGFLSYGIGFFNAGYTLFLLKRNIYYQKDAAGIIWKGGSVINGHSGFVLQLQFCGKTISKVVGLTMLIETRLLQKLQPMHCFKMGVYF